MKKIVFLIAVLLLLGLLASLAFSREKQRFPRRVIHPWSSEDFTGEDIPIGDYIHGSAAVDTYVIVRYDFEQVDWQGWQRRDNTAQFDTFWHVEDYLEPELAGLPGPLEGAKSMWCGAPPAPYDYVCGWASAPGYGDGWDQQLISERFEFAGRVYLSYRGYIDCEAEHDFLLVQYDAGAGNWQEFARIYGTVDTVAVHEINISQAATKLRFRFISDNGLSDRGGLDTHGAVHLDSITIADIEGTIDYENFESAADGDKACGLWHAELGECFGGYSGFWTNLQDKDPCNKNYGTQIVFFLGSGIFPCPGYPGLYSVPFTRLYRDRYEGGPTNISQDEMVYSPVIDMTKYSSAQNEHQDTDIPPGDLPQLNGANLCFTVYRARGPSIGCIGFYFWHVRNFDGDCPGSWLDHGLLYFGEYPRYNFIREDISSLVGSDSIQVALGFYTLAGWYVCEGNDPSPWFDNVVVERYKMPVSPQWTYQGAELFQDNFPEDDYDIEGYVRADMAQDIGAQYHPVRPGDSIVVRCDSPRGGGIRENGGGPEVYMHVKCLYIGPDPQKPPLAGSQLEGTYGHYVGDDGTWTVIQGDTAKTESGGPAAGVYMFDLNDSLFTRGYMIEYYFKAFDNTGASSTLPHDAQAGLAYPHHGGSYLFEFTCLPTLASDILYVDDFHGRGTIQGVVELYFAQIFDWYADTNSQPDRYDINAPTSWAYNGPGSRASIHHVTTAYSTIIWDSGDLGTWESVDPGDIRDKSEDALFLIEWMDSSDHDVGLWVLGDNAASTVVYDFFGYGQDLLNNWCGTTITSDYDSYYDLTGGLVGGGVMNPRIKGTPSGIFFEEGIPDTFCLEGGCPDINNFDVPDTINGGVRALVYGGSNGENHYAAVQSERLNSGGYMVRTMWFGFSMMNIRDCEPADSVPVRWTIFDRVMQWFGGAVSPVVPVEQLPALNSLAQNYPNPFNPSTTIRFSLRSRGKVTVRIYNVAGQLVRTLVDGVRDAGVHREIWHGTNDRGAKVASGIYFYRMESGGWVDTKKMVLLR